MPPSNAKDKAGAGKWTPYLIAGAAVIGVIALVSGNKSSGGGVDTSGLAAEQAAQLVQAEAEKREAGQDAAMQALAQARDELSNSIRLSQEKTLAAINASKPPASDPNAGILAALNKILERLTAPAGTPPTAPTAPTEPAAPRPSKLAIEEWERGINLPSGWGFWFVDNFGRLPSSIAELDKWRAEKAIPSGTGGWCIHWGGELKCI